MDYRDYKRGTKVRVTKPGAHLSGMTPISGGYSSWSKKLNEGDVLTVGHVGAGWGSDPGHGVHFSHLNGEKINANYVEFRPMQGGMWAYRPAEGWVEVVDV